MRGRAVPKGHAAQGHRCLGRSHPLDRLRMGYAYADADTDTDTVRAGMKRCNALFKPRANTLGIAA